MCLIPDVLKCDCEKVYIWHFCEQMNKKPIIRSALQGMLQKKEKFFGFMQLSNKASLNSVQCHINIYCILSLL